VLYSYVGVVAKGLGMELPAPVGDRSREALLPPELILQPPEDRLRPHARSG